MRYFIKTFGCQQNVADSERISQAYRARGHTEAKTYKDAEFVIVNTCMVRTQAENRVYGLVRNLAEIKARKKAKGNGMKIIVTGCMVGLAFRDKTGKYLNRLRKIMPEVDEFMPIEEIGFDIEPARTDTKHAWIPISNGCNNFCTFCVVPFTRGREISRPFDEILAECATLRKNGFRAVTLLGQNVNSYGADLILGENSIQSIRDIEKTYFLPNKNKKLLKTEITKHAVYKNLKPVYVTHLGRMRIPTLFPHLLEQIAALQFDHIDFMSSNPWDFSDTLIDVIAHNPAITRRIHLPVQSGDNEMLKKMNRWYTREQYIELTKKLRHAIPDVSFSTDIIVGFCGETEAQFQNTVDLCKTVGFEKAYIAMYTPRPHTAATKVFADDIPHPVKKKRWQLLDSLINTASHA